MLRAETTSAGSAAEAWSLFARPARWPEWAPYIRGARGLGAPEVQAGCRGAVLLLGLPLVPAAITEVVPGRSWRWRVGPVEMNHVVLPDGTGSRIRVDLWAPAPLEAALRLSYGPLMGLSVRNLSRIAARAPRPRPGGASR
jgi:Polyketide cyclase / dehydrase and lipid transport